MSSSTSTGDLVVAKEADVKAFVVAAMVKVGLSEEEGAQLAELLVEADLRGHASHGLNRLVIYLEDVIAGGVGKGTPHIIKQKGATAWVDGDNALGVVVGNFCTELATQLAKEHGVGWVVAKNSNHYGICGHYSLKMASSGLVGFSFTNTSPILFPNRAATAGLGTNPLSVCAHAEGGDKFALDMATTAVAYGKVEIADRKGKTKIPAGWGVDSKGRATTDPKHILHGGGLSALGSGSQTEDGESSAYKGTGLAMAVELLCGVMGGASFGKNIRQWRQANVPANLGQCFIAVDPECFSPEFPALLKRFLNETRNLEPVHADKPVLVAGDPEEQHIAKCAKANGVLYERSIVDGVAKLAEMHGVEMFPHQKLQPQPQ